MIAVLVWVGLILVILLGVPIAFGMGIAGIIILLLQEGANAVVIAQRAINGLDSYTLLAIPFFMVAAQIMAETGVGEKIFDFANSLVSPIPGGLGQVNIVNSVIQAGMSGSAVTDITGMGKLEMEAMERAGYDKPFAAAITATSALLGPIIPPSIPMVLYGSIAGVSLGGLLFGGVLPGIIMALVMMIVVFVKSRRRHYPTYPRDKFKVLVVNFFKCLPCLLMPLILLGGMLGGIMTPTESACAAVLYAVLLGTLLYRNLSFKHFFKILEKCSEMLSCTMLIISCAAIFGLVLTQQQVPQKMVTFFMGLSDNPYIILIYINIMLLILGCLLETTSIYVILGPILAGLAARLGMDPVHFGVMVVFNVNIALITPPVGMVMFLTCKVANIKTAEFVREMRPFLIMLFVALVLVIYFPILSTFLPKLLLSR
jgi:tripartite ATP-independent transporter DctM subunit